MTEAHDILDDATTDEVLNAVATHYDYPIIEKVDDAMIDDILMGDKYDEDTADVEMADSKTETTLNSGSRLMDFAEDDSKENESEFSRRCKAILCDEERLNEIRMALYGWCGARGYTSMNHKTGGYTHLPSSLFPYLMPLSEWLELRECSLIFHKLIDAMSRDSSFLLSAMKGIAAADPSYTGKFYAIYQKQVEQQAFRKKYNFNSLRVDYMRNANRNGVWCQIEAQFSPGGPGWLSQGIKLHQYLCERFVMQRKLKTYDTRHPHNNCDPDDLFFVPNDMTARFCNAVATAAKLVHPARPLVLIVSDSSRGDCNLIELNLWEKHGIPCIYRTYAEIGRTASIEDGSFDLIIDDGKQKKHRVSFVYCRGGSHRHEWTDKEGMDWKGRELIEFSSATTDCTIAYTLINTKFMQTVYSQKEVLLKYVSEREANLLCKHFVGNYNFDESLTSKQQIEQLLSDVQTNYDNYVMKPSGDGGGHCIFGEEIPKLLDKVVNGGQHGDEHEIKLGGWILMEKIRECVSRACHIRNNEMSIVVDSIQEVGIFSHYLCDSKTGELVLVNECIGDLVKTRKATSNEAGIAEGFGVLQTLILDAAAK